MDKELWIPILVLFYPDHVTSSLIRAMGIIVVGASWGEENQAKAYDMFCLPPGTPWLPTEMTESIVAA